MITYFKTKIESLLGKRAIIPVLFFFTLHILSEYYTQTYLLITMVVFPAL